MDEMDAERARLIDSIYEAVLRPEHYDAFMDDWSTHIERAANTLGGLRMTAGAAARLYSDPVIESHFNRAFAMLERMGRGPDVERLRDERSRSDPLLTIDRAGTVVETTGEPAIGVEWTAEGFWGALDRESAARLRALVASLGRAPAIGQFVILSLTREGADGAGEAPRMMSATTARRPDGTVVVEVRPLQLALGSQTETVLAETFRLTPREIEVARALAEGLDPGAIALRAGRSTETVRTQLKSVFHKTRTSSQADLVRLLAAVILYSPVAAEPAKAMAELDTGTLMLVEAEGGRQLPVHLIGPPHGRPVVFIHGMLDGVSVTRRIGAQLEAHGLRLVAPVRANFGMAPVENRIREAPSLFAGDLGLILEALELRRPVLLGHMAGSVYAFAAAARLGRSVAGIIGISGGVPIRSVRQFSLMTPRQRTVAYTARFAPALLPAILRAGIAQIDGSDVTRFMNALYPQGARDRSVVENASVAAAIIDGYRFSVAQGPRAFQTDSWHVTRDWSEFVLTSSCPVMLIHGRHDPVVNIETVREFAATSNRIELIELAEEGQLLFYSQPERVVAAIAGFARRTA